MCTRTIHINDKLLEQVRPVFPTDDDLQRWLEEQMESVLMSFSTQLKSKMPCSYTDEEMYAIIKERLQNLENGTAELVDGEEVFSKIRARYGFKASLASSTAMTPKRCSSWLFGTIGMMIRML